MNKNEDNIIAANPGDLPTIPNMEKHQIKRIIEQDCEERALLLF
jgi:hypothetical protein